MKKTLLAFVILLFTLISTLQSKAQSKEELIAKASSNDLPSMHRLGMMYEYGKNIAPDQQEALKWFEQAAAQGYAPSEFQLGMKLIYQDKDSINNEKGKQLIGKSADAGYPIALGFLSKRLIEGIPPFQKDLRMGFKYLYQAVELQEPNAQAYLGMLSLKGLFIQQDLTKAFDLLSAASRSGITLASYYLGYMAKEGIHIDQSYAMAIDNWTKSANGGFSQAQYALGYMYYKGLGVEQDYNTAYAWFKKSADQSNSNGLMMLGVCYALGVGVEQDNEQAKKYLYESLNDHYNIIAKTTVEAFENGTLKLEATEAFIEDGSEASQGQSLPAYFEPTRKSAFFSNLSGVWRGMMGVYDYSGKVLEEKIFISLTFETNGANVKGFINVGKQTPQPFAGTIEGNTLTFTQGYIKKFYPKLKRMLVWELKEIVFEEDGNMWNNTTAKASIVYYVPEFKENAMPVIALLNKRSTENKISVDKPKDSNLLTIKLSIAKESPAEIRIVDMGMNYNEIINNEALKQGNQTLTYDCAQLRPGIYIVKVQTNQGAVSARFVR